MITYDIHFSQPCQEVLSVFQSHTKGLLLSSPCLTFAILFFRSKRPTTAEFSLPSFCFGFSSQRLTLVSFLNQETKQDQVVVVVAVDDVFVELFNLRSSSCSSSRLVEEK